MYTEFINLSSAKQKEQVVRILTAQNLTLEVNLDYLLGLFDAEHELVAIGGAFKNTLRSIAVAPDRETENLSSQLISALLYEQMNRGYSKLFLYTKPKNEGVFNSFGFSKIAETESILFMSNQKNDFEDYLLVLERETNEQNGKPQEKCGAIVMNANPVTKGHLYLIESAASKVDLLHLFLLSEDVSEFPFSVRKRLLQESTRHIPNLCFHETKEYLVSQAVFPAYFIPEQKLLAKEQAILDAEIFKAIAARLNITHRFVGEEPLSVMTSIYNQAMQEAFLDSEISLHIIPRKTNENGIISASKVRQLITDSRPSDLIRELENYVPNPVLEFLKTNEGLEIIQSIKGKSLL